MSLLKNAWHLTPMEARVLELVCEGRSTAEIATRFHRNEYTVKRHMTSIFNKSGAGNRTELAFFAFYHGIIECPCCRQKKDLMELGPK